MTAYVLVSHPDHPPLALRGVDVAVVTAGGELSLAYRLIGGERVVVPARSVPTRSDGLWHTTCFELFLMFDDDERYVEFNFSPSTHWAAYSFDGYRDGMAALDIRLQVAGRADGVDARCDLRVLAMALTAVIEEEGGVKSYWSLAHPPGAPDFHHPACFAVRLPAPGAA